MYNSNVSSGNTVSLSGSRLFVYEVEGLRNTAGAGQTNPPIRKSGSVFITVPYSRMTQEMQRIQRMGGTIVNIHSLGDSAATNGQTMSVAGSQSTEVGAS
ncbi:MAG: phycobilisome linker polypeptide, partial [Cyanobacteria bacterium J06659_2]